MNSSRPVAARAKHSQHPLSSLLGSLSYVKHRGWFCLLLMENFLTEIPYNHRKQLAGFSRASLFTAIL